MRAAAAQLLGEHDFSAFRSAECQAKNPVRTMQAIALERDGERIEFSMRANAWLQHMARNIVGTLVYVGAGKHPPAWARAVLDSRNRARAAPTFASEGLYLEAVEYEAKWELPAARQAARPLAVAP
jgi:tRNA pseudouridine38-40 synthase